MTNFIKTSLFAGLGILSLSAMMGSMNQANAAELGRGGVRVAINDNRSGGHYEIQTQQVLVQPERNMNQVIPAIYETRYDRGGRPYQELVRPARTETVCIPARYETVQNRVWVEDNAYTNDRPGFFSFFFGRRDDRRDDHRDNRNDHRDNRWNNDRHDDHDHRR